MHVEGFQHFFFVARYTSDGDQAWIRQFGTFWSNNPLGVDVDDTSVYVYGWHPSATTPDASSPPRAFLTKFEKASPATETSQPSILPQCVPNAATYIGGAVALGEMVTIFGTAIGPPEGAQFQASAEGVLPKTLAGTRVLFGDPAPLLYVSQTQSVAIVPYAVAGKSSVGVQLVS